ncbi:MAG TPA: hypothetical protein VGM39_16145 [Kofleriaceae bacterium]|jgi:hypothetical protein
MSGTTTRLRHTILVCAVALVALIVLEIWAIGDCPPADPIWYAQIADHISHGLDAFRGADMHPFWMRIGLTVPLAALYDLVGRSPLVTTLPTILAGCLILVTVVSAQTTARARWIAAVLVVTSRAVLQNAVVLGVDLPCAALLSTTVLFLGLRSRGRRWLALAAVAWFSAFLVKETALWLFPVWLYVIVTDYRRDGISIARRYLWAAVPLAVLAIAYMILCAMVWGHPLARFMGIQALAGHHTWAIDEASSATWMQRLLWKPPGFLFKVFGLVLLLALAWPFVLDPSKRLWGIAAFVVLAFFWFGSTSLTSYSPLPLSPRMVSEALPFVLGAAAMSIDALWDRWRLIAGAVLAVVVVQGAVAVAHFGARPRPESEAVAAVFKSADSQSTLLVCGDPRSSTLVPYYAGFVSYPGLRVVFAADLAKQATPPTEARVYALVNVKRPPDAEWFDPATDATHFRVEKITRLALPQIIHSPPVSLYDAGDGRALWTSLRSP